MRFLALLPLFMLLWMAAPSRAALYLDRQSSSELAGHLETLEDDNGHFTIEEVASGRAGPFKPLPGHFVSGFGGPRGSWLRFTLDTAPTAHVDWWLRVLPPYLDRIDLYQPAAGGWEKLSGGDNLPFGDRALDDRAVAFPLKLAPGSKRTFYLHISQDGNFNAYLTLYSTGGLNRTVSLEGLLFGSYFGIIVALLIVNILHWIFMRERVYAEFSVYLIVREFYFLAYNGYLYQFLLPNNPEMARELLQFLLGLVVATTALFLVRLFNMAEIFPRLARLCHFLGILSGLIAVSAWFGLFTHPAKLLSYFMIILGLAASATTYVRLRRKEPYSWLLFGAMSVFMVGIGFTALSGLGISSGLLLDLYGAQIASIILFLAFHFTVAMNVMGLRQSKAASDKAALLATEMAERERAARREQSDFIAMMFHEVKTPLAVIDSAATVLEHLDDGSRSETARRYDAIHGAVQRLNLLVGQSLAWERLGMDKIHLSPRTVEIAALAQEVVDGFEHVSGQRIDLAVRGPIPPMEADPAFLRVALSNLIDNAVKYAAGEGEIQIVVSAENGGALKLAVCDQGPGMDEKTAARVFDRYWRGNAAGKTQGAGLGLYLVRRIAEAHGGSVDIETAPGQGTCFILSFPRKPS